MAINFPSNPNTNDTHTVNGRTWVWDGAAWKLSGTINNGISLEVSDTAPATPIEGDMWYDSSTGSTFTYYDSVWVELGNTASVVSFIADSDGDTRVHVEESADEDTIRFDTAGTERLTITSAGHVLPSADVTYDLGSSSYRFRDLYLSGSSIDLGGVTISSDGTSLSMPPIDSVSGDFTVDTSTLHVDSTNDRVGIGTTSPAEELHIEADQNGDLTQVLIENSNQRIRLGAYHESGVAQYAKIQSEDDGGSNTVLALNPEGGSVGIGTTSPSQTLDVRGIARVGDDTDRTPDAAGVGHLMVDGNGYGGFVSLDAAAMWVGHNSGSRKLYLATDETARVTVAASGNVGIGVDSPAGKLTINHDNVDGVVDFADGLMFTNNAGGGATEWSHAGIVSTGSTGFNGNLVFGTDGDSSQNTSGITERMRIDSSGNVGINDSTPSHKLDVNGDVRGNEVFNQKVGPSYPSSAGWYTIATCPSGRASGLFNVHDPRSSYHGGLTFYVNHLYGQETITLINHNYYSGSGPITGIRVKGIGVYDGAAVQVYLQVSSGGCEVFLSENYGEQTWTIKDFIPDGTDPGGQSGTWSSFTQQQYINLNGLPRGSTYTTGTVYGSSKSFSIPHPTREDYTLNHGAIEGPENGVYHRGRCVDGTIVLPEYWDGLVDLDTVTVQLTPIGEHSNWVSSISGREVSVGGGECFYIAYGERVDIDPLVVESPMYPDVPPEIEGGP